MANLCIELRERSGDDPVQEADYEQERTDLLRAANHDPLIILDNLRANLRIQLAFKEDYEHELKATLQQKWDTQQMEINRLRARIKEMDRELVVVKDRRDHAEREVEAAEARGRAASEKVNVLSIYESYIAVLHKAERRLDFLFSLSRRVSFRRYSLSPFLQALPFLSPSHDFFLSFLLPLLFFVSGTVTLS